MHLALRQKWLYISNNFNKVRIKISDKNKDVCLEEMKSIIQQVFDKLIDPAKKSNEAFVYKIGIGEEALDIFPENNKERILITLSLLAKKTIPQMKYRIRKYSMHSGC